jgi:hypothetical protein
MGIFDVEKNNFLVFETGPSENLTLQWATYRDASDQTSLSRIWGGIHPPIDDIKGRIIGDKIGNEAFTYANQFFNGTLSTNENIFTDNFEVYPNPFLENITIKTSYKKRFNIEISDILGKIILSKQNIYSNEKINLPNIKSGIYFIKVKNNDDKIVFIKKLIK